MQQNGISSEMANAGGMYRLKPFYDSSTPIDLPTSMYRLNGVHARTQATINGERSDDATVLELEQRQDRILSRLEALRLEVDRLLAGEKSETSKVSSSCNSQCAATKTSTTVLKVSVNSLQKTSMAETSWEGISVEHLERRLDHNIARLENLRIQVSQLALQDLSVSSAVTSPSVVVSHCVSVKNPAKSFSAASRETLQRVGLVSDTIIDLVLSASPSNVPLSLFVLFDLLSAQFTVLPTSYVHSSSVRSKTAAKVADVFRTGGVLATNRSAYQLGFTVIWKEDKRTPSLTIKINLQTSIVGEANIARYLARLLGNGFYDDAANIIRTTQIDEVIDIAAAISAKIGCMTSLLNRLEKILGSQPWILGKMSLADVVMWSAIKRSSSGAKIPESVRRWMNACSQQPEFALACQINSL